MLKHTKVLSWILFPVLIFIIVSGFDKCSGNPPDNIQETNKQSTCDTGKPIGKILNSNNIKDIDSLKRETTKNLNAIHRYGAGCFIVAGDSGTIMITPNGGLNWLLPSSGTKKNLYGSVINDYDTMMVVGDSGKVLRSNDKGVTWINVNTVTTRTLRSIIFPTKYNGYSCGDSGMVLKTNNAGLNWVKIYSDSLAGTFKSIYFADTVNGWLCTSKGKILKTVNGGSSWTIQYNNASDVLNCISFNGSLKGTAVGNNGKILETNDGGSLWSVSSVNPAVNLYGVHRINDSLAFICGQSTIIRETNGTKTEILSNTAYKFNAVDPDPYIMGLTVADLGLIAGVSVGECDCGRKNDLVMFPTEENNKWKITIRLNNLSDYRYYFRIIIPGFELDNSVLTGWTQSDQINSGGNTINYTYSSSSTQLSSNIGGYSVSGVNDVITINLNNYNSAYLNLNLIPNGLNSTGIGSVNFFQGNSTGNNYCASVKYELSN